MTAPPASFEPLAASDPVPGDPYEVAALGKRLSDTAAEIETQVANLRKLAEHSSEFWTGKAASKFHDSASDLAGRIEKAHRRYDTTGSVLTGWSKSIDEAQGDAYPAVLDAQEAERELADSAPQPAPPAGSPPPTADEAAAAKRRAGNHTDAQTKLTNARNRFEAAVGHYNSKAKQAADAIGDAASHDGLKDSWWDRNFHWIAAVMKIVAIVIIVLAVIAIVIACPFSAALLVGLGVSAEALATVATVVELTSAVLVGLSLLFDSTAAATGKQSWTAAELDVLALCTFGFGKVAESALGGLAKYGEGVGKTVTSARAGRAYAAARGLPKALYSLSTRSPLARSLFKLSSRVGTVIDGADQAGAAASKTLATTIKGVKGSNLIAALSASSDVAADYAKISKLSTEVSGTVRLAIVKALGTAVAAADSTAQSVTVAVTNGYAGHTMYAEPRNDAALEARLDEIIARFRHQLVHVP